MSSGITRAPSKSMIGPVATAARTQRIFSRSSRCAVCLNLKISKSSMPKAFTTRLPLTVSCRIWLRSPSLLWLFLEEVSQVFRKSDARALHVVDRGGEQTARRIGLKETNRLANDLGVYLVPQPGDRSLSYVLNLRDAQILGDTLRDIKKNHG